MPRRRLTNELPPEEALFAAEASARPAALAELMRRFGRRLFALARHLAGSDELAEELVQECFVRLWQRAVRPPAGAPPVSHVYGYLRRVLVNLTYHQRRPDSAVGGSADEDADPISRLADEAPGPEQRAIRIESADLALAAMARLDPDQRAVLALRVLEGRSYQELADELGWPIGTVMSRLHRARAALAEMLGEGGGAEDESAPATLRLRRPG